MRNAEHQPGWHRLRRKSPKPGKTYPSAVLLGPWIMAVGSPVDWSGPLGPLIYGRDGNNYLIVASKGGAPDHPGWYKNLLAYPDVKIQV
jgi:hypothetical protein